MLRAQRKLNHVLVFAHLEQKLNGPFLCPDCKKEVLLRKSVVRVSHFAHRASSHCSHSSRETEAHRRCKKAIYEALSDQPGVTDVALERSFGTVRPDVSALIRGVRVAIEVQLSTLSLETIAHRTSEYARKGIYVLWLAQWTPYLDAERYSPRLWEKWVHACYFGRVYYWKEGLCVLPYRFEPHYRETKNVRYEISRKQARGNLRRKSKRYRTPIREAARHIVNNFMKKDRDAWEGRIIKIGGAKLFIAQ